jgi:hypothetical protein
MTVDHYYTGHNQPPANRVSIGDSLNMIHRHGELLSDLVYLMHQE